MTEKLRKLLEKEIEKVLHLYEMEDFSARLNSLLKEEKISQSEYDELQKLKKNN